jgi:hypothetical protein
MRVRGITIGDHLLDLDTLRAVNALMACINRDRRVPDSVRDVLSRAGIQVALTKGQPTRLPSSNGEPT